jgi:hypothetical protein
MLLVEGTAAMPQPSCVTEFRARLLTNIGESSMKAHVASPDEFSNGCYTSIIKN